MADPLTNIDIEDVLASIRRLIVDGAEPPPAAPGTGRLVLTQALRVAGDGAPAVPAPGEGGLLARLREVEAMRAEPLLLTTPTPPDSALSDSDPPHPASLPMTAPDLPDPLEVSAAVPPRDDATPQAGPTLPPPDLLRVLSDRPTVAPRPAEPPTPDAAAMPLVADSPSPKPQPLLAEPSPTELPLATALDETALRALVADVLRQELQGELGERITRNLRKLVRREVFRVLSAREEG